MSPGRMSRIESAVRMVVQFNEAFNRHDVEGMMQLMGEDCVFENTDPAPDGARHTGKAAVTEFWRGFFRDSPHAHIEIEELVGLGPRCVMLWRYDWTASDGTQGHVRGVDVYRVSDGLIREKLSYVKG